MGVHLLAQIILMMHLSEKVDCQRVRFIRLDQSRDEKQVND